MWGSILDWLAICALALQSNALSPVISRPLAIGEARNVGEDRRHLDAARLHLFGGLQKVRMCGKVIGERGVARIAEVDARDVGARFREFECDSRPIPRAAPVTIAFLPLSSMEILRNHR